MELQIQQQTWFYDDRAYYNYVLLNSSEEIYLKVQSALRLNNIKVIKAAPSFRPASNGVQYKWYIRIQGDNGYSPTAEQINSIVQDIVTAEQSIAEEECHDISQEQIDASLRAEISELQEKLKLSNQELQRTSTQLSIFEKTISILKSKLDASQAELAKGRLLSEELRQQIKGLFRPEDVKAIENLYASDLKAKEAELDCVKRELQEYVDNFQPELNRVEIANATLTQERDRYLVALQAKQEYSLIKQRDNSQFLFFSVVQVLLPKFEFIRNSLDFAWNNFSTQELENIFRAIASIDTKDMRAERVEGINNGWKEFHPERVDWRIYFRKCQDQKYQVLISDKSNQEKRDLDWLKNQPKN